MDFAAMVQIFDTPPAELKSGWYCVQPTFQNHGDELLFAYWTGAWWQMGGAPEFIMPYWKHVPFGEVWELPPPAAALPLPSDYEPHRRFWFALEWTKPESLRVAEEEKEPTGEMEFEGGYDDFRDIPTSMTALALHATDLAAAKLEAADLWQRFFRTWEPQLQSSRGYKLLDHQAVLHYFTFFHGPQANA